MKKQPTKKRPASEVVFSVKRFYFLMYKGQVMKYSIGLRLLGGSISKYTDRMKSVTEKFGPGICGGPVPKKFHETSLRYARAFFPKTNPDHWTIQPRFKVMRNDVITSDTGFDYSRGCYRTGTENGFKTRLQAFAAAETLYKEMVKAVSNGHGTKPSSKVRLLLTNKQGDIVKALHN